MDKIIVRGARTHNLKNIDIELPRGKLIVITGLSGSGKSSLAFDTLYAEGQRRYVESLSSYARQFLSIMSKPDVDHIEGLSPAISIEQKVTSHNPRSTVGTATEIHDYLRLLFARTGIPRCPVHNQSLEAQTISQMVDQVLKLPEEEKVMLLAPVVRERKGEHIQLLNNLQQKGFVRVRINGVIMDIDACPVPDKNKKNTIEVVVDRFKVRAQIKQRLAESFETALSLSNGLAIIRHMDDENREPLLFSSQFACKICNYSMETLEPRLFSFNNPAGACPACDGLGVKKIFDPEKVVHCSELSLAEGAIRGWNRRMSYYFSMLESLAKHYKFDLDVPFTELPKKIQHILLYGSGKEEIKFSFFNERGKKTVQEHPFEGVIPNLERRYHETESLHIREEMDKLLTQQSCTSCDGSRLKTEARHVFIDGFTLPHISSLSVDNALDCIKKLRFSGKRKTIAKKIIEEICERLKFLVNVGLNYLTLNRSADTLSGGETQRIRLASQIGSGLTGVMYILDEPSIGLHQRDNAKLLETLIHLRNLGNTVIVVEHDEDAIRHADYIVDLGPGAGTHGGEIVAYGKPAAVMKTKRSLTGQYLSGKRQITIPHCRRERNKEKVLTLTGCNGNNLKDVNLNIPAGIITCITGVSGSGKSTLINNTLYPIMATLLNGATTLTCEPYQQIEGTEYFDKCIDIDQSPIGRTPRSNPATYTGIFTIIRELFSATQEARSRGYKPGRFSFNVKGGRCEACEGDGVIKIEMHFLPDVYVDCDVCKGKRYNRETLEINYKGKNISEVLDMTVEDALTFFSVIPALKRKIKTLVDVGLSYITLGQSATTLSGGEAQRIKLAKELSKRDTGKTLYVLDEPTTGLHFEDIKQLIEVLEYLCKQGNTIVIIEHNMDVIKRADWIIDLGPEGGDNGGKIIAEGTPEDITKVAASYTGRFLKQILQQSKKSMS
ncbi:MAG: excinuclease ABC subunit UvrA [Endozoicomonadaceae bacterium]|nr:excinuclease ABC subunit UvrA [Endozoicomonadaceae bacterium]